MTGTFFFWIMVGASIASSFGITVEVDGPYYGPCSPCPEGPPGPRGLPGRDGRDGRDATCGSPSPSDGSSSGTPGGDGGTGTRNSSASASGAVYVRWGRDECVEGSELVYAGTAAGAHYTQTGSGSNYLCMPHDPIYDEYIDLDRIDRGLIYSSEYETATAIERLHSLIDHTPKCAICRAPSGRSIELMIPGRNLCPSDDWRLEYRGYLMSDYHGHKRSEFVCFDHDMEAEPGTGGNQNGALFYMVRAACLAGGGLPCGPYVDDREITCAVCTI